MTTKQDVLEKAKEYGIDLTLLYENLSLTPTERIEKLKNTLEFVEELRKPGSKEQSKAKDVLTHLKEFDVDFIIIGGMATIARGSTNIPITNDIDICYARDKKNLVNLVKALTPFHPHLRGAPKDLPFTFDEKTLEIGLNFPLSTDAGYIDLIGEVSGLGNYDEVLKYSEKLQIYDMECYFLTIEGLIKNKKVAGKEKDLRAVIELEALLQIKKDKEK
ncbi:MAG: hypothetical protein AB1546_09355 [bacterium]